MFDFETPVIPQKGNYLEFIPKHPGKVGIFFIKWTPIQWSHATQWKNTCLKTFSNSLIQKNAIGYKNRTESGELVDWKLSKISNDWVSMDLHKKGTAVAITHFFSPTFGRNYLFRFQPTEPADLYVNGKKICKTAEAADMEIEIPAELLNVGLTQIAVVMTSTANARFKLSLTSPEDTRFLTEIPPFFDDRMFDDWPRAILKNKQLEITVALPDPEKGFYRGTRFEHAGIATSIKFTGTEFTGPFFLYNNINRIIVAGTAEEFDSPINYETVKTGEPFLKMGVGLFIKPVGEKYEFPAIYWPVKIFPWTYRINPSSITFKQIVNEKNGIAYEYEKTLRIIGEKPEFRIEHKLTNTGQMPLETSQYCHNFTEIDGRKIGAGYSARYNVPVKMQPQRRKRDDIVLSRDTFFFNRLDTAFFTKLFVESPDEYVSATVMDKKTGKGICYSQDFIPERLTFYVDEYTISPEFFFRINLKLGETQTWTRTYSFINNLKSKE